jgi:dTDP-4-dehydrorhamnose 3,5-epimerase-like enzyme
MAVSKFKGAIHSDERGKLIFFNEFSMEPIKRFYEISPSSTETIRAWQGHLIETKWFYCTAGSFVMNLLPLTENGQPNTSLVIEQYYLTSAEPLVLKVPGGYASGFRATHKDSNLMVFSDASVAASKLDDYRFLASDYHADWNV